MEARRTRPRWPDDTPAPVTPVHLIQEQVELNQNLLNQNTKIGVLVEQGTTPSSGGV